MYIYVKSFFKRFVCFRPKFIFYIYSDDIGFAYVLYINEFNV